MRRPRRTRRRARGRGLAIGLGSALAAGGVALALGVGLLLFIYAGPGPQATSGAATDLVLRSGASLPEIAQTLARAGVVRSAALFEAAAEITGKTERLKAGEYEFASREPMARVLTAIAQGAVVRHWLTVPEGATAQFVAALLARTPFLVGVAPVPPEGAVLPETYEVQRGEDRAAVLQRMLDARDEVLAALWRKRRPGLPFKSPQDAVILASIVEKETALADERPRVAAVFVNQLERGMRLESDPTVIYGLTGGRPLGHGLRASELALATPYNTYLSAGLPPTPIANPGRASLAAVLDPPRTDDIYFVASGAGGHVFSASLEEHQKNVARWRALEKARAQPAPS